jgi:hypothetical protein
MVGLGLGAVVLLLAVCSYLFCLNAVYSVQGLFVCAGCAGCGSVQGKLFCKESINKAAVPNSSK